MALLQTPTVDTSFTAPNFELIGTDNKTYTLSDIAGTNGALVMFICNHCPYVKGIVDRLSSEMEQLQKAGIGVVAIMANDVDAYPEDNFANMQLFAKENGFTFPYLLDKTQEVAKAYGAVCTPDFFGFDKNLKLAYRGRLDSAGHKPADSTTTPELRQAMLKVASGNPAPIKQTPSMGCSIKWKN